VIARVLIVEDNPTNCALMEYLLKASGHSVLTATNGSEGLAAARAYRPDIVLMDLQMPVMNGFDAVREMRRHAALARTPIVAVTAFAMVGDRDKILASGFDGYISKPIAPETFADQLMAFLSQPAVARPPRLILAVDNSPVNLAVIRSTLEPCGYEVAIAGTVDEALANARARRPDLILADVHMPGKSGYDLIEIIKGDTELKAIPFALITSTVWGAADKQLGLALGARAFIERPIEPADLVARIAACVGEDKGPR
jgi:two-component system, cell cycle response regulator